MSELTECGYILYIKDLAPLYVKWDEQDDMAAFMKEHFEVPN